MISSLKRALQPAVTDISIKFDMPSSFKVYQAPEDVPTLFSGDKVVVYGIMKKRKSASDQSLQAGVNGTATLKAQILSKPVEFKITFEIPPPSDFQSSFKMPIVHHLASKALICELQGEESWTGAATYKQRKKDVVNLSIESGVVSSHTAYIALDEEQGKLIEGAVTTWDIVATMAQSKESILPPNKRMFNSTPLTNIFMHPMCCEVKNDDQHFEKFLDLAMQCASSPSYRPSRTQLTDHSYLRKPLKISSDCYLGSVNTSYSTFSASAETSIGSSNYAAVDRQNYDSLIPIPSGVPDTQLKLLISLQKAEGFWGLDVFFRCKWLCFLMPLMRDNIKEICATVYALAYMEIKFASRHDEWELVARKAEAWLECQMLPDQVNLDELKKEASDYIITNLVE